MAEVPTVANPFDGVSQGGAIQTVMGGALAARENTETLALIAMARRFPRDQKACSGRIIIAFQRTGLAEESQYEFARGGTKISGPSIRSAEAIACEWTNLSTGWSELERFKDEQGVGVSVIEAFAIDYQTTRREAIKFVVRHWRDRKEGQGYPLREERDIYELCANQAQRRKRACILALIPGDVIESAMLQADATLKAKADTSPEGVAKLLEAFAKYGVTKAMVEKRLQRNMDAISPAQMVGLKKIGVSLRDGMSDVSEWFELLPPEAGGAAQAGTAAADAAAAVTQASQQRRTRAKGPAAPSDAPAAGAPAQAPADASAASGSSAPPPPAAAAAPAQAPAPSEAAAPSAASAPAAPQQQESLLPADAPVPADSLADEAVAAELIRRIEEPAITAARALELLDSSRTALKTKAAKDRVAEAYDRRFGDA